MHDELRERKQTLRLLRDVIDELTIRPHRLYGDELNSAIKIELIQNQGGSRLEINEFCYKTRVFVVHLHLSCCWASSRCLSVGLGYGYTAQNNDLSEILSPSLSVNTVS